MRCGQCGCVVSFLVCVLYFAPEEGIYLYACLGSCGAGRQGLFGFSSVWERLRDALWRLVPYLRPQFVCTLYSYRLRLAARLPSCDVYHHQKARTHIWAMAQLILHFS